MNKLFIISNESIFINQGKFFCDNIDMKSTSEGLNNKFEVNIIARESKKIIIIHLNSDQRVIKPFFATTKNLQNVKLMAERVGFEPTVPLTVHKLSKPAP